MGSWSIIFRSFAALLSSSCHLRINVLFVDLVPCLSVALSAEGPQGTTLGGVCCRPVVSCLSVAVSAEGPGGSILEIVGRDDLGGFSTPVLLKCRPLLWQLVFCVLAERALDAASTGSVSVCCL